MKSYRRLRSLVAGGVLGWASLAITPMGCAHTLETAPIRGKENSGVRVPGITEERLRQCVVDYAPEFAEYTHVHVYGNVKVNEEGRKLDVTTAGNPASSPDFGKCTRQVLEDMDVPISVLLSVREELEKKQAASQQKSGGNLVGHPVVIVVAGVAIVLSDVVVQVGGITVLFTITLALDEAVEAAKKKRRKNPKDNCTIEYAKCMDTNMGDEAGNNWNQSRCGHCLDWCNKDNKGSWPSRTDTMSCEYWKRTWPN